ncbi:type II secretion system protein [Thermus sp.]|uniref:type II secretion system protein n=1 Tax=Thermus sp. TaxID=275 RepID=UPI0025F7C081|nr:prepilin-type N-terminal cleavage/methylation domain-containing protein [Thermus sp.]MCS6869512.1 prepilin-type N-terminal cleavage/methylation domain-containing protein [Thermus sp.]
MSRASRLGFTLIELLVAVGIFTMVTTSFVRLQSARSLLALQERRAVDVLASAVRAGGEFAASRRMGVYLMVSDEGTLFLGLDTVCATGNPASCFPLETLGALPRTCTIRETPLVNGTYRAYLRFAPPGMVVQSPPGATLTLQCSRVTQTLAVDRWANARAQ